MNKNIKTWQDRRDEDIKFNGEAQPDRFAYASDEITDLRAYIAELEARTPAAPVVAEGLTDIPNGVYYSDEADNFYSMMSKQGMGRDFHMEWRECKHLFPQSDWKADAKAKRAAHPVAGSPAETCHCNNPIKQCNDKRPGCKVVAHMRNAAAAEPMPASEAASVQPLTASQVMEFARRQGFGHKLEASQICGFAEDIMKALAAPAAPTDAKADDDLFEEMVEEGYTALAEHSNEWRGDPEASPSSARESFAVALRAAMAVQATAAQSVRDAAQPTVAPGKDKP